MRRRARAVDGQMFESFEEHALRRGRQTSAPARHRDAPIRLQHAPDFRERLPWILEIRKRLPEDRDIEHVVIEDQLMRVHDRVVDTSIALGPFARVGDHVRGEIERHMLEVRRAKAK